ncbi:MAG: glucose-6-phosphate dehydrogenase, partial [Candidatus Binatia bacterium]
MAVDPTAFVIFGGGGDLAWRKLIPALFNLWLDQWLPAEFQIIGIDGKPFPLPEYLQHARDGIDQFSRTGKATDEQWTAFSTHIAYTQANFDDAAPYAQLSTTLDTLDKGWSKPATRIFYLSTPPTVVQMIARHLHKSGLSEDRRRARLVCEKPFGRDLESAVALNSFINSMFEEAQIYRIDHYLGKETVQNIL